MKISTKNFGEITINPEDIINFEQGLPGFPGAKQFVVLFSGNEENEDEPDLLFYMQSINHTPDLSFVLVDMTLLLPEYRPEMLAQLEKDTDGGIDADTIAVYNIVTVYDDMSKSTVNLKAPVIIDITKKSGKQIICTSDEYPIRTLLFESNEGGEE